MRRLLPTTQTLEIAIAPAAIIGLRSPATASGIASQRSLKPYRQCRFLGEMLLERGMAINLGLSHGDFRAIAPSAIVFARSRVLWRITKNG